VFELRVYGEPAGLAAVSDGLAALPGVRHLAGSGGTGGSGMVTADVRADSADAVIAVLNRLSVPRGRRRLHPPGDDRVGTGAGAAGILAVETRASTAVGVAISVTTVPAVAYLAVGLGVGEFDKSLCAFWVLAANVAMMLVGGSTTLAVQRALALRSKPRS
jgi:hypothetical protein